MIRSTLELLVCTGLTVGLLGCGQATEDANRAKTVEAVAIVTHNGAPVEGATVVFEPAASQPRGAMGRTDASGKAILRTYDAGDGAIPGAYQVAITKSATSAGSTEGTTRENYAQSMPSNTSSRPARETKEPQGGLPAKYGDAKNSGLKADVTEAGPNEFKFDLTD